MCVFVWHVRARVCVCVCVQILKLEARMLQAEQQCSREREAVFQCRVEAANRVKHLRTTIQVEQYSSCSSLDDCNNA